ncbi:hypothetical protein B0H13DRAFT_2649337 [Mycena leptocephala]|nr:hypothetical protein B0H13DRAFT_2649337 [Mycena leptocephala]
MPLNSTNILDPVHAADRPPRRPSSYFLPTQVPASLYRLRPGQSSLDTTLARTPSLLGLLLPIFAFSYLASPIAYVITKPRFLPCTALPILSHLPPYPPAYQSFDVLPSSSCTVFPIRCDAIECGHFVHGSSFRPTFIASVSIPSLAFYIHLDPLSCRFPRLPRAVLLDWIYHCWASWIRIPLSPPSFFSSSRRRHGQYRSRVSAVGVSPVSPSSPHIHVALAIPGRYHNPTTYDLQLGTSFDARTLRTVGAPVNLAASPFVPSRTRRQIDSKVIFLELRALPTRLLSPALRPLLFPSAARVPADGVDPSPAPLRCVAFLVCGCPGLLWRVHAHPPTPTLTMDSGYLSSAPACARTLIPVIRTHEDDESMCPLRAILHSAVILGAHFHGATHIPRYLRSNPRGSKVTPSYVHYDSTLLRPHPFPSFILDDAKLNPHTNATAAYRPLGLSEIHTYRALFLAVIKSTYRSVMRGRTGRVEAGVLLFQSGTGARGYVSSLFPFPLCESYLLFALAHASPSPLGMIADEYSYILIAACVVFAPLVSS